MIDCLKKLPVKISCRYYLTSILVALLVGGGFYLLLLKPLEGFIQTVIHNSVRGAIADIQRICEHNYSSLLRAGVITDAPEARIQQAVTLGLIKDYADSHDLRVAVFADGKPLLDGEKPVSENLMRGQVSEISLDGQHYYTTGTTFSPWGWQLLVFKESTFYQSALQRLQQAYYVTIFLLLTWVLLGVVFFKHQIEKPMAQIISSLRRGEKPAYRGVYEFKFLSDHLTAAMTEQEQLRKRFFEQQKLESMGLLVGGVAHDFNNLLAALYGQISMASLDLPSNHPARQALTMAEQSADRARALTGQLLTFATGGNLNRRAQNIAELISEIGHFVVSGPDYQLRLQFAQDLWEGDIDREQMGNVLHNLLLNAKESMPEGGTVEISGINLELPANSGLPLPAGRYLLLKIRDHGHGIKPEVIERIFEPYFSTKCRDSTKGTGLGLSICRSVVEKHGGHIEVSSQLGHGTIFTIYLPAAGKDNDGPR